MGSLFKMALVLLALMLLPNFEPANAAITRETDFVAPVEPTSVLRSTVIPCYGKNQSGIGRKTNLSRIEGERCSVPQPVEARRLDRPDHDTDDPGRDFKEREL